MNKKQIISICATNLAKLEDLAKKMHNKPFQIHTFQRKFQGILKFKNKSENEFLMQLKGFKPLNIKIDAQENFPTYAIINIHSHNWTYSFPIESDKMLMSKILEFGLLNRLFENSQFNNNTDFTNTLNVSNG